MDNTSKFIFVLAIVAVRLAIAAIVKDNKNTCKPESMTGLNDDKSWRVGKGAGWGQRSDAAARTATANLGVGRMAGTMNKMKRMETQTSILPASLYAGLNYGAGSVERIPASQPMIDALDGLFDNTKVNATMGEDAVFYLRKLPSQAVVDRFNMMTLSAVKPEVQDQVVVVVQSSPSEIQGKYAIYAFLDKDVQWGQDMVDYCQSPEQCVKSDIYINAGRRH